MSRYLVTITVSAEAPGVDDAGRVLTDDLYRLFPTALVHHVAVDVAADDDPLEGMGPPPRDRIDVYRDEGGEWRWRRVAGNGEVVADSGEGYRRRIDATREAEKLFPGTQIDVE